MIYFVLISAIIMGRVTDKETGKPIYLCTISLEGTRYSALTDEDGRFKLEGVPEGEYVIRAKRIGYETARKKIKLNKKILKLNLSLKKTIYRMQKITVSAQRQAFKTEIEVSTRTVFTEQFLRAPATLEPDVMRVVQALPGVSSVADYSAALFVRGGRPDENLVLLDENVVFNPQHFGGFFSTFDATAVRSVRLYAGGFPAEFADRLSSVMDVRTKEGRKDKISGDIEISLLSCKLNLEGPIFKESNFIFTVRRTYFDKVLPLFHYKFPYYFYDLYFKPTFNFKGAKLMFSNFISHDRLKLSEKDFYLSFDWINAVNSFHYFKKLSENSFLHLVCGHSYFKTSWDVLSSIGLDSELKEKLIKFYVSKEKGADKIKTGANIIFDNFYYYQYVPGEGFSFKESAFYPSLFLDLIKSLGSPFLMRLGLRINYFKTEEKRFNPVSPRFSLKYFIDDNTAIAFSTGYYTQFFVAPSPRRTVMPPFITAWMPVVGKYEYERSIHFVLSFEKWIGDYNLSIETYYKIYPYILDMKEMQNINLRDWENTLFDEGKGEAYGVDFMIKKNIGRLTGWLSYSLSFVKYKFDTLSYYPSHDRRHNLKILLFYNLKGGKVLSFSFTYASGNPYTAIVSRCRKWLYDYQRDRWEWEWVDLEGSFNSSRYPAYHRADVSISIPLNRFNFNLSFINIYNRKNVFFYYWDYSREPPVRKRVNMIPFFVSVGIKIKL